MAGRLENKVAIVTGAGGGIGQGIAEKLAEEGAAVVVAEVNEEKGKQVEAKLQGRGFRAMFVATDITAERQVRLAVEKTVARFGWVDILVNNAGKNFYYDATKMTSEEWDRAMEVDVKGAWLCCKYAIPPMIDRNGGSIINIASVHASMTTRGMFPYAAAKSALVGMTRSLALDYGRINIRVNAVSPGWVRTYLMEEYLKLQPDPKAAEERVLETLPSGKVGTPRDVANLVAFLASDEASYINGTEVVIDGGLSAMFAQ